MKHSTNWIAGGIALVLLVGFAYSTVKLKGGVNDRSKEGSGQQALTFRDETHGFKFEYPATIDEIDYFDREGITQFGFCGSGCGLTDTGRVRIEAAPVSNLHNLQYSYFPPANAHRPLEISPLEKELVFINNHSWLVVKESPTDQSDDERISRYVWMHALHEGNLITIVSGRDLYETIRATITLF